MLHRYALALFLLVASWPARAQDSLATTHPAAADTARLRPPAPATTDTAAALHRLFRHKRRVRNGLLAGTLLGGGGVVAITAAANSGPGAEAYTAIGAIALGIIIIPSAMIGELLYYNSNYSRRHERRALAAWQAHRLAPDLRRRLAPYYFAPAGPAQP